MSMRLRFRLAGMALVLGGLTAGFCHLFHFEPPTDLNQLAQYTRFSEPVHLLLFAGGILVLLGWFGQYALQCSASGALGFGAFLTLFVGILFGDLLHCILEFSVFPGTGGGCSLRASRACRDDIPIDSACGLADNRALSNIRWSSCNCAFGISQPYPARVVGNSLCSYRGNAESWLGSAICGCARPGVVSGALYFHGSSGSGCYLGGAQKNPTYGLRSPEPQFCAACFAISRKPLETASLCTSAISKPLFARSPFFRSISATASLALSCMPTNP